MKTWLDTETKAILQKSPPDKLAPPDTKGFTLVLLSIFRNHPDRLIRAIERIRPVSRQQAIALANQNLPLSLRHGLTESDALLGQFELVCCDALSVFIPDVVIKYGTGKYLTDLYDLLRRSDEFSETNVAIESVPDNEPGAEFVDQFLGRLDATPSTLKVPFKKARIMIHWGSKIGAKIRLAEQTLD